MYAFNKYINGTDPDNYAGSYMYMVGLDASNGGTPYVNPVSGQVTRYVMSGDPVTGTGWVDNDPSDCRTMASFGPFNFRPGDTQQLVIKLAVGQGTDRLNSITALRETLDYSYNPFGCCIERVGNIDGSEDNLVTMADLTVLIDHLFISLAPLVCFDAGNVDMSADGLVTMSDLTVLIDHLFITLTPLPECP
jgi:hypothetical protein